MLNFSRLIKIRLCAVNILKQFDLCNINITYAKGHNLRSFSVLSNGISCRNFKNPAPNKTGYLLYAGVLTYLGLKEKTPEDKESELITIMKRSILLIQKEEFKKAEQMLHIALKVAQEQGNANGITYIYDLMANLAFDTGDYPKAEKLFITVMQRVMGSGVPADDNKVIHISVKLAKIFEALKQFEKAENGYRFCVDTLETKVNENQDRTEDTLLLWAMSLDFYAHFLLSRNRIKEARDCFKKALERCSEIYGKEHEQIVVLLNDLGSVSNLLGENQQALEYLEEAVKIGENLPQMTDLAAIYVNLGQLYFVKNLYSESESACKKGWKLSKKYADKETEGEANTCLKQVKAALGR